MKQGSHCKHLKAISVFASWLFSVTVLITTMTKLLDAVSLVVQLYN